MKSFPQLLPAHTQPTIVYLSLTERIIMQSSAADQREYILEVGNCEESRTASVLGRIP